MQSLHEALSSRLSGRSLGKIQLGNGEVLHNKNECTDCIQNLYNWHNIWNSLFALSTNQGAGEHLIDIWGEDVQQQSTANPITVN